MKIYEVQEVENCICAKKPHTVHPIKPRSCIYIYIHIYICMLYVCLDTSNSKCQDVQHCIMQLAGRGLVLNIVGSEIRRENQLRLVVEIPLFTRFWDTSQVFLPSTVLLC